MVSDLVQSNRWCIVRGLVVTSNESLQQFVTRSLAYASETRCCAVRAAFRHSQASTRKCGEFLQRARSSKERVIPRQGGEFVARAAGRSHTRQLRKLFQNARTGSERAVPRAHGLWTDFVAGKRDTSERRKFFESFRSGEKGAVLRRRAGTRGLPGSQIGIEVQYGSAHRDEEKCLFCFHVTLFGSGGGSTRSHWFVFRVPQFATDRGLIHAPFVAAWPTSLRPRCRKELL